MADAAISYGTQVWLADLKRSGWHLTVSEQRLPAKTTLRLLEDEFEPLTLLAPIVRIGVLALDGQGDGVFVPCDSKESAWRLLERVDQELAGVV